MKLFGKYNEFHYNFKLFWLLYTIFQRKSKKDELVMEY